MECSISMIATLPPPESDQRAGNLLAFCELYLPFSVHSGVLHGDEIFYHFGDPFMRPDKYDDVDRDLSAKLMEYWTDFARTGCVRW